MQLDFNLNQATGQYHPQVENEKEAGQAIDDFIHGRSRILRTKLEVLAFEIHGRLIIRLNNLERIDSDKVRISNMLADLDRQCRYLTRQHRDKETFYEQLQKLEQERREQDVECWRDVVMVMRDFLYAWEGHQTAQNKAILLDHV